MKRRTSRAAMVVATVAAALVVPASPSANAAEWRAVTVEIRPGSADAPQVNLGAKGVVPVAIVSGDGFDARTVVPTSVCFGDPDNALQRDCSEAHGAAHHEDVDRDGDVDALFHFDVDETGFDAGDRRGCLEATTTGGARVYGCDAMETKNGVPERDLPDLTPTLAVDPPAVDGHSPITWTATVVNDGLGAVTVFPGTAVLRFEAPANLLGVAVAAPAGYDCAAAGTGVFDCSPTAPDTIPVGTTRTFTLTGTATAAPGPITVKATTDPTEAMAEVDETDNVAEAVTVVRAPNLTTALAVTPGAVSPGDVATWTATLRNGGPGSVRIPAATPALRFTVPAGLTNLVPSAPADWACAVTTPEAVDCAPTAETTLVGGAELVFRLMGYAPATPGNLEVTATADPTGAVAEGDETDNAASAAVLVTLPNLVTSLAVSPETPGTGQAVTWTATVVNSGPGGVHVPVGTPLFRVTYSPDLPDAAVTPPTGYVCTTPAPRTFDCAPTSSDTMAAGADRTFTLAARAPADPGSVEVTATADPAGAVAETDEADNAATRSLAVTVQSGNLAVTIDGAPDPVDARRVATWTATVRNSAPVTVTVPNGTALVRFTFPTGLVNLAASTPAGYTCFISAPNTVDCAATAATTVAPGAALEFRLIGTVPRTPGPLPVTVVVDPLDAVVETDDADNSATDAVTVQPPDFSMTLTATPDPVDARRTVTWNAVITNDGPAVAVLSTGTRIIRFNVPSDLINLAVSSPPNTTCFIAETNVVECETTASMTVPVGGTLAFAFFGTAPRAPGERTLTATADPLGVIPELDETDNAASAAVTVQPPDFSMVLTGTPDPVDARTTVTWNARITNDGPAVAVLSNGMTVIRYNVPDGLINLAASSPPNTTCFIAATNVVECTLTASRTVAVGETLEFAFFGTAPRTPGDLTLTATADPMGAVPEADETDNAASDTVTVQPPDFSVTLTGTPDPVDARRPVTWTATVHNDGPAQARLSTGTRVIRFDVPAGLINLAVSSPPNTTCFITETNVVECETTASMTVAAGSSLAFSFFGTTPRTPGDITLTATADPANVIPEGDETDNAASDTVTVQPPDLSMVLTGTPDPVDARTTVTWNARITNDGPAVAVLSNGMTIIRYNVPEGLINLAASSPPNTTCFIAATNVVECTLTASRTVAVGETLEFAFFGTAPRNPGDITLTATADPLNAVPEADEADNAASDTVTVRPPDFSVAMATSAPVVATGGAVSWDAVVTNDGPAVARVSTGTTVLRFSVPAGVTGATGTAPAGYTCAATDAVTIDCTVSSTQTIPVGGTVTFTMTGTAPTTPGDLTSTATADPRGAVPEADEADNSATGTITVA